MKLMRWCKLVDDDDDDDESGCNWLDRPVSVSDVATLTIGHAR